MSAHCRSYVFRHIYSEAELAELQGEGEGAGDGEAGGELTIAEVTGGGEEEEGEVSGSGSPGSAYRALEVGELSDHAVKDEPGWLA
jgi:hypothetical protein